MSKRITSEDIFIERLSLGVAGNNDTRQNFYSLFGGYYEFKNILRTAGVDSVQIQIFTEDWLMRANGPGVLHTLDDWIVQWIEFKEHQRLKASSS